MTTVGTAIMGSEVQFLQIFLVPFCDSRSQNQPMTETTKKRTSSATHPPGPSNGATVMPSTPGVQHG